MSDILNLKVFAMPETALGLFPDIGASYFLSRLPRYFGMCLTKLHLFLIIESVTFPKIQIIND